MKLFFYCLKNNPSYQYAYENIGLKFLLNYQLNWFGQSKRAVKNRGLISMFMKATIPGTHGRNENITQ